MVSSTSSRNIIERTYPKRCEERVFTMQLEDRDLLQRFKQTRDKESQLKDKASAPLRQEEVRRLVSGLCCLFFIVVAILVSVAVSVCCPSNTGEYIVHAVASQCLWRVGRVVNLRRLPCSVLSVPPPPPPPLIRCYCSVCCSGRGRVQEGSS